ncbi:hypothetical protein Scep_017228 [Stephania cephalantha]|uniref:Pentatricopeptide repeat-containing protein n=1 Tax=Stephania cephalantha TaxID=152367 RepID=A0AAP0IPN5_9MAGN
MNAILKGHVKSKSTNKALLLFRNTWRRRRGDDCSIDSYTVLLVLKACMMRSCEEEIKHVHTLVLKLGFHCIVFVQTMLVNAYSGVGLVKDAHKVFDEMRERNVVCWTGLISAYVDNGRPSRALKLFRDMQMENVEPDSVTVTVALCACADLGALEMGEWIHSYVRHKRGFKMDLQLKNAVINMYAKCGDIGAARRMFDDMGGSRNVTTWTSMIVGHALHGQAEEALQLFEEMRSRKHGVMVPNDVTYIGVLMACSHAGLVEEGRRHLESMSKEYGLSPRMAHYGCMVDLLCRRGQLNDAYQFVVDMPIRANAVVWRTLLGACSLQGNIQLGAKVRSQLLALEPDHARDNVTMSNAYAAACMWDAKEMVRAQMKHTRKVPGCSSIELESSVHEFVS